MPDESPAPEPTELVYVPEPSWAPFFAAVGLAAVLAGLFTGWAYSVIGAIVLLVAVRVMVRGAGEELDKLPRRQRVTAAVLPPHALRRR